MVFADFAEASPSLVEPDTGEGATELRGTERSDEVRDMILIGLGAGAGPSEAVGGAIERIVSSPAASRGGERERGRTGAGAACASVDLSSSCSSNLSSLASWYFGLRNARNAQLAWSCRLRAWLNLQCRTRSSFEYELTAINGPPDAKSVAEPVYEQPLVRVQRGHVEVGRRL